MKIETFDVKWHSFTKLLGAAIIDDTSRLEVKTRHHKTVGKVYQKAVNCRETLSPSGA